MPTTNHNKFGPVAPIQVLEGMWAAGPEIFGDYHLLLAHHTVAHKARFRDLFKAIADKGHDCTIIMDNSIVELGDAVGPEMVAEAVSMVNHGEIICHPVLPDVMGDGEATRQAIYDAYDEWLDVVGGDGFMAVCQGSSFHDYVETLEMVTNRKDYPHIDVIGIPRVLTKIIGSRVRPALVARQMATQHKIHFLGFSDSITDDIDAVKVIPGAGIDSAVPLRYREVFTEFIDAGKRPSDWFETAQIDRLMIDNLQEARRIFGDPGVTNLDGSVGAI